MKASEARRKAKNSNTNRINDDILEAANAGKYSTCVWFLETKELTRLKNDGYVVVRHEHNTKGGNKGEKFVISWD